jgi:hypothetical protein
MKKILLLAFLLSCSKTEPEFKASYHMLWQSTEILSGHETVKLYYDVSNENLCYLYYYDGSDVAHQMTCVKQPRLVGF